MPPQLINALDLVVPAPLTISPDDNLLDALGDLATLEVETLPVPIGGEKDRRLVGLLPRSRVMRRYREGDAPARMTDRGFSARDG